MRARRKRRGQRLRGEHGVFVSLSARATPCIGQGCRLPLKKDSASHEYISVRVSFLF